MRVSIASVLLATLAFSVAPAIGPAQAASWNVFEMKHKPVRHHPYYHAWVLRNLSRAHTYAEGDVTKFIEEFHRLVRDRLDSAKGGNPLIADYWYWKCYGLDPGDMPA